MRRFVFVVACAFVCSPLAGCGGFDFGGSSWKSSGSSGTSGSSWSSGSSGSNWSTPSGGTSSSAGYGYSNQQIPVDCRPDGGLASDAQQLYSQTEDSVHELITCGGAQLNLARTILMVMLAANDDFLEPETRQAIETGNMGFFSLKLNVEFMHYPNTGQWEMFVPSGTDAWFSLYFFEPAADDPLKVDVFDLDSWLIGAEAVGDKSLGEMMDSWNFHDTVTFVWTYEELGPLGHLLDFGPGGEPADKTFEVKFNLADLISMAMGINFGGEPDWGPFEGVFDLALESQLEFADDRAQTRVEYEAAGLRDSLHGLVSGERVEFELKSLKAEGHGLKLNGATDDLAVLGRGRLAGTIDYTVTGEGVDVEVESDFGYGQAYPNTTWSCPPSE